MAFLLLALLMLGRPALAQASLVSTNPQDGAILASGPKRLFLSFSEPVSPLVLKLVEHDGREIRLNHVKQEGSTLSAKVPKDLPQGTFLVSWRVLPANGHPLGGAFVFSIGAASEGPLPQPDKDVDEALLVAIWFCRLLLYGGLFLGVGGALFNAWMVPGEKPAGAFLRAAIIAAIAATIVSVGLQGLDALDLRFHAFLRGDVWTTALATSYGTTVIAALIALALSGAALLWEATVPSRALSLAALVAAGVALATSGHAAAIDPEWLTETLLFVHTISIICWVGPLVPLGIMLAGNAPRASVAFERFSRAALFALAPLLASGAVLAMVEVESPSALLSTPYGHLLLLKLLVVLALLTLKGATRWRLADAVEDGDKRASQRVGRAMRGETAFVMLIFAIVALFRFTAPPQAILLESPAPISVHIQSASAMADVTVAPGHSGPVSVRISVLSGGFGALPAKGVTLILSHPGLGMEPLSREAEQTVDGSWRVDDLTIPLDGRWDMEIDILGPDSRTVTLKSHLDLR